MSEIVFFAGIVWLALLLGIVTVRLARADTTAQRILALDLLTVVMVGLLALAAGDDGRSYALDAALALALLGFVATLAACRYYEDRGPFG
jgi:multicomponent Na+:H+ antiporter subunit F